MPKTDDDKAAIERQNQEALNQFIRGQITADELAQKTGHDYFKSNWTGEVNSDGIRQLSSRDQAGAAEFVRNAGNSIGPMLDKESKDYNPTAALQAMGRVHDVYSKFNASPPWNETRVVLWGNETPAQLAQLSLVAGRPIYDPNTGNVITRFGQDDLGYKGYGEANGFDKAHGVIPLAKVAEAAKDGQFINVTDRGIEGNTNTSKNFTSADNIPPLPQAALEAASKQGGNLAAAGGEVRGAPPPPGTGEKHQDPNQGTIAAAATVSSPGLSV